MRVNAHGWLSYLAPYGSFLVIVQLKSIVSEPVRDWLLVPQVLVPGGLLLYFLIHRVYPELQKAGRSISGVLADVFVGLGIAAVWMAPYVLGWLEHPPPEEGFDPAALGGEGLASASLLLRFTGFVLVTPFIEELFVRSALMRYVAGYRTRTDFRSMPLARFEWPGFIATVLYFTFSHASWEWPVALTTGVMFNLWLYYRGSVRATVLAHAVANAAVFLLAVLPSETLQGKLPDLRFFL